MRLSSMNLPYVTRRVTQIGFQRTYPDAPWLTASAVIMLGEFLRPSDVGMEWGSGRSTLWFGKRVKHLRSVEASPEWYARVQEWLHANSVTSVDHRNVPCELREVDEPAAHPYADAVNDIADESLDFALVDGHIRLTCMRAVLPKLKRGGLLILDNANRYVPNRFTVDRHMTVHEPRDCPRSAGWKTLLSGLSGWRSIPTTDGIWDTRFWLKP